MRLPRSSEFSHLATSATQSGIERLRATGGEPIPGQSRRPLETRLGLDLGAVRIHRDSLAQEVAEGLHAQALTFGNHIALGKGNTHVVDKESHPLLAHEIVHTVQQDNQGTTVQCSRIDDQQGSASPGPAARELLDELMTVPLHEMLDRIQEIDDGAFLFRLQQAHSQRQYQPSEVERAQDISTALNAQYHRIQRGEVTEEERQRRIQREKKRRLTRQIEDFEAGRTAAPGTEAFERLVEGRSKREDRKQSKNKVPRFDVGPNEVKRVVDPKRGDRIIWSKGGQIVVYREPPANLREQILERTGSERQADIIEPTARAFYQRLFDAIQDDEGNPTIDPRIAHAALVEEDAKLMTMAILGLFISLGDSPGAPRPRPRMRTPSTPPAPSPAPVAEVLTLEGRANRLWRRVSGRAKEAMDELAPGPAPVTPSGARVRPPKKGQGLSFSKAQGAPKSGRPGTRTQELGKVVEEQSKHSRVAQVAEKAVEHADKPARAAGGAKKAQFDTPQARETAAPPVRGERRPPTRTTQPEGAAAQTGRDRPGHKETVEEFEARGGKVQELPTRPQRREAELSGRTHVDDKANAPEVFDDPSARASVKKKPAPGRVPNAFKRGNFAHRFAERILGLNQLPRPNEAEVVVQLRDGTGDIIRADRIQRSAERGMLIELRPAGRSAQKQQATLQGRVEAISREFPKPKGWTGKVVTYRPSDVEAWLRAEGVSVNDIPLLMAELGF
jgi:hypothetical protein